MYDDLKTQFANSNSLQALSNLVTYRMRQDFIDSQPEKSPNQVFELFELALFHPVWERKGLDCYLAAECLTRLTNQFVKVMDKLSVEQGNAWQANSQLQDRLGELLTIFMPFSSNQGVMSIINVIKYMAMHQRTNYQETLQPQLIALLTNQMGRMTDSHKLQCLKELAFLYQNQTVTDQSVQSLFKTLFYQVKRINYGQWQDGSKQRFKHLGLLVQSFYALKRQPFFEAIIKDDTIKQAEQALATQSNYSPDVEHHYIDYLANKLNKTIDKQALCCGFSLDGLIKLDEAKLVNIEVDGSVHKTYGKYLGDQDRDALITANHLWLFRLNSDKDDSHIQLDEFFASHYLDKIDHAVASYAASDGVVTKILEPASSHRQAIEYSLVVSGAFSNTLHSLSRSHHALMKQDPFGLGDLQQGFYKYLPDSCWQDFESLWKAIDTYGMGVNSLDRSGETVLHRAIVLARFDIVKALVDNQADVALKNSQGQTPLQLADYATYHCSEIKQIIQQALDQQLAQAIWQGSARLMERLVEGGCDITQPIKDQPNAVHLAANLGQLDSLKYLIDYQRGRNYLTQSGMNDLLNKAVLSGNPDIVHYLLSLELTIDLDCQDEAGYAPIHYAIRQNDEAMFELLLIGGAKLQLANGMTTCELAQHYASQQFSRKIVEYLGRQLANSLANNEQNMPQVLDELIEQGCPVSEACIPYPESEPSDWITPLQCAIIHNQYQAVQHLINHYHAPLDALSQQHMSALHFVAQTQSINPEIVALLLNSDHACKLINQTNAEGVTPLLEAIKHNNDCVMDFVSHSQADLSVTSSQGLNVLHYCIANDVSEKLFYQLIDKVKQLGLLDKLLYQEDARHYLPVHSAAERGNKRQLIGLSIKGANLDQPTNDSGMLPIHVAAMNGHLDVIRYLVNRHKGDRKAQLNVLEATDYSDDNITQYAQACNNYELFRDILRFYIKTRENMPHESGVELNKALIKKYILDPCKDAVDKNESLDRIKSYVNQLRAVDTNSTIMLEQFVHIAIFNHSISQLKYFLEIKPEAWVRPSPFLNDATRQTQNGVIGQSLKTMQASEKAMHKGANWQEILGGGPMPLEVAIRLQNTEAADYLLDECLNGKNTPPEQKEKVLQKKVQLVDWALSKMKENHYSPTSQTILSHLLKGIVLCMTSKQMKKQNMPKEHKKRQLQSSFNTDQAKLSTADKIDYLALVAKSDDKRALDMAIDDLVLQHKLPSICSSGDQPKDKGSGAACAASMSQSRMTEIFESFDIDLTPEEESKEKSKQSPR